MRKINLFLILSLLVNISFAQRKVTEISHYILPEFTKGIVLMKSGQKNPALLNYNALTEEMIFDSNGKNLAITKLEEIDTVYVDGRKFFPLNNKFVEIVYHNKYDLYALHKGSIVDPGKPSAYGGTSQTSSTTVYSSYFANGMVYNLQLPEGVETKASTDYWLKKDGKVTMFLTMRQLAKLFEDKSGPFKKFVKQYNVKYEDQESLVDLIKFLEQN